MRPHGKHLVFSLPCWPAISSVHKGCDPLHPARNALFYQLALARKQNLNHGTCTAVIILPFLIVIYSCRLERFSTPPCFRGIVHSQVTVLGGNVQLTMTPSPLNSQTHNHSHTCTHTLSEVFVLWVCLESRALCVLAKAHQSFVLLGSHLLPFPGAPIPDSFSFSRSLRLSLSVSLSFWGEFHQWMNAPCFLLSVTLSLFSFIWRESLSWSIQLLS